jgi:L-lactate dehydrogenase (cytochrome)
LAQAIIMTLSDCHSIADLRILAQRRLPPVMFDYLDGGAEDELTLHRNRAAFADFEFVPRVLTDVSHVSLGTRFAGVPLALPIVSAPTGMSRMFHHLGERAVVRATHAAGTAYCLSTVSTTSIEDVAASSHGPLFFQVYAWKDKEMVLSFLGRCKEAKYNGIMLAVDLPTLGKRDRDLRNGHGRPAVLRRNTAMGALTRPAWLYSFLTSPRWRMANMVNHLPHGADALKVVDEVNAQFRPDVTWDDARQMRDRWNGPFILKGIQSVEDAILAADMGVTGIVISNHGGRQLEGAPAPLHLLSEVCRAVGHRTEVYMDGGVMRGGDVVKALALGARAVLIGKAYLYGLAAGGEAGVARAYAILHDEMERTMRLIGCTDVAHLHPGMVRKVA